MIRITTRRSQKLRVCGWGHCSNVIAKGDLYLEHVVSPNHDDLGNIDWMRMGECLDCAKHRQRWS